MADNEIGHRFCSSAVECTHFLEGEVVVMVKGFVVLKEGTP